MTSPRMKTPFARSSRWNRTSRSSSSFGVRYCATECSTTTSRDPDGRAAISSGVRTSIFGFPPKRRASAARTMGAASHRISRPGGRRDEVGVQRLAAAIIEHGGASRKVRADVLRNLAVMHVAMARIDVDRMFGIPEGDPVAHRFVPTSPGAGRRTIRQPPYPARARSRLAVPRLGWIALNLSIDGASIAGAGQWEAACSPILRAA